MSASRPARVQTNVQDRLVREQLDKILSSNVFARTERLRNFLRFIVKESLQGRADSLKELVLACEIYGRGADFEAAIDPVVRVDARRLRDKLREYYSEFPNDPLIISLPKGGYAPAFERNPHSIGVVQEIHREKLAPSSAPGSADQQPKPAQVRRIALAVAAVGALAAAGAWLVISWKEPPPGPVGGLSPVVPLTTFPGNEGNPSFSPDGSQVAFNWDGGKPGPPDIYVKVVGSERVVRLTDHPHSDYGPAWSPDGRWIAFIRKAEGGGGAALLVSPLGGPQQKVADDAERVAWTPDSASLLVSAPMEEGLGRAIDEIKVSTRERRRLTHPEGVASDIECAVSPDGKSLAVLRCANPNNCDIYLTPLAGGDIRRLTHVDRPLTGLAWTPDGREIVYSTLRALVRVLASDDPAERRAAQVFQWRSIRPAISPSLPGRPVRLAFERHAFNRDIWRTEIISGSAGSPRKLREADRLITSTWADIDARYSPDGSMIAFSSNRSGRWQSWLSNSDGSEPRLLHSDVDVQLSWSPDGQRVLGQCVDDGDDRDDLCVVHVADGTITRIAPSAYTESLSSWSRDGRWVYFTSDRSGAPEVWKAPSTGGEPMQVTSGGGMGGWESPDGKELYFFSPSMTVPMPPQPLLRMPVDGGPAAPILDSVHPFSLCVEPDGIYYLDLRGGPRAPPCSSSIATTRARRPSSAACPWRSMASLGFFP